MILQEESVWKIRNKEMYKWERGLFFSSAQNLEISWFRIWDFENPDHLPD